MNSEQKMLQDIAELKANQTTLFKRVERNENLLTQIHKLTATVENLVEEMKNQNSKIDKIVDTLESRLKSQGERLGEMGKTVGQIEQNKKDIADIKAKLDELRMEPANKWRRITFAVIRWAVLGALALLAASQFFYIGMYY